MCIWGSLWKYRDSWPELLQHMTCFTYHPVAKSSPKTCYTETHSLCLPPRPHPSLFYSTSTSSCSFTFLFFSSLISDEFLTCFVYLKYSRGQSDAWTLGRMDGRVGGWRERGIFFTWPCIDRARLFPPTLCLSSPDGPCLWLGWQFLPLLGILAFLPVMPPHPPASGCLLVSVCFHLYWHTLSCFNSISCQSIYRYCVASTAHRLSFCLPFFGILFGLMDEALGKITINRKVMQRVGVLFSKSSKQLWSKHKVQMNLYLPHSTGESIFIIFYTILYYFWQAGPHNSLLSPSPVLLSFCGNTMWIVMFLSPVLDQPTLCIHSVCLNGLTALLTDKTLCVCVCFIANHTRQEFCIRIKRIMSIKRKFHFLKRCMKTTKFGKQTKVECHTLMTYRSADVAQAVMKLCDGPFRLLFEEGGFWIWVLI